LAFLDVTGNWDPSLAFVMGAAIPVAALGFALAKRRRAPLYDASFSSPAKTAVDSRLVIGSLIFGTGWGLAGFCPGPVLASFLLAGAPAAVFLVAMLVGMAAFSVADKHLRL
ncbi:YeeE/YedE family protein, partial [Paeniroseomonas aquatica]